MTHVKDHNIKECFFCYYTLFSKKEIAAKNMLTVTADSTVVTGHPMITINQRSLRAEVKVSDSGTNMKLYAVHMNHIYYFVRFCLLGSKHRAIGKFILQGFELWLNK